MSERCRSSHRVKLRHVPPDQDVLCEDCGAVVFPARSKREIEDLASGEVNETPFAGGAA